MAVKTKNLTKDVAPVTAVRTPFVDGVAAGLTPGKLADILKKAAEGDHYDYLTLAEEMEEKDPHYGSVLRTRRLAVTSLEPRVVPPKGQEGETKLTDAVKALVGSPLFEDLLDDLLDALGKGYSATEIMWNRGALWTPGRYEWRDPRFFQWDKKTGRQIRLRDEKVKEGLELPPNKFVIHTPKLKSGIPLRGGLARLVALSYLCKQYTIKDWLGFIELFGLPIRVGKYGNGASDEDIAVLKTAVASLGADAAAVLPESMQIEFVEVTHAAGGSDVFKTAAEWIDRQVSKAILGQTMTTDDGSSRAQASVHNEIRIDILQADAKQLAATINRDLIRPFIDLNFGPQEVYPTVELPVPEKEDLDQLTTSLEKLVPLGLEVDADEVRGKFGLSKPKVGANLLKMAAPAPGDPLEPQEPTPAANHAKGCPHCQTARNSATGGDDVDDLVSDYLGDWEQQIDPLLEAVRTAVNSADSYQDLAANLSALTEEDNSGRIIEALAEAGLVAHGMGAD